MEDWKRVTLSDETKTNRLGSGGRKWARKLPGEGLADRLVWGMLKFGGGSVTVWGCMSWTGTGNCCGMDGWMDGDLYTAILDEDMTDGISHFGKTPSDATLQQDTDPKHACKKAKEWLKSHQIKLMPWPTRSPDLNPTGHLWQHLKRRLGGGGTPHHLEECWSCEREWSGSGRPFHSQFAGIRWRQEGCCRDQSQMDCTKY